jgi:peptidoglycan/LPS O-acetylase OafA/YrhL
LVVIVDQIPFLRVFAFPLAAWATAQFLVHYLSKEALPATSAFPVRALQFIGVISYSIYLLHQPIYHDVLDLHGMGGFAVKFPIAIVAFMIAAYLLYRFVETPGIRAGKAVIQSMRQTKPARAVEVT